jgi:phosphate transport system substrate-binding protein
MHKTMFSQLRPTLGFDVGIFWFVSILALGLFPALSLAQDQITLVGSGGSSPVPVFRGWAAEFSKQKPGIKMEYLVLGTSNSIDQISRGSGDFGAGDTALTPEQRAKGSLVEFPVMLIGVVPIYNLPGPPQELKFSGEVLAAIYLGHIKNWNAPQIAKLNPGATLPDVPIKVVYRTAGKGTSFIFTDFLSKASPRFREQVGASIAPHWPVGSATERSSDMADRVKSEPGSIGYVELQYARDNNIPFGLVQNAAGKFVKASAETMSAACSAIEAPQWNKFSTSLTNAPGANSYPITSFSWIYIRTSAENARRRAALFDLLNWTYSRGQQMMLSGYAALPDPMLANVLKKLNSLK